MAPVIEEVFLDGVWVGAGGSSPEVDDFVSGLTALGAVRETPPTTPTWDNTGHRGTLTPYTGPGYATGYFEVTTPGVVYSNVDFGSTRVRVLAANVGFDNCRWHVTNCAGDGYDWAQVDTRWSPGGTWLRRCTIENVAQNIRGRTGILGHETRIERCRVRGFIDNLGFYVDGTPARDGGPGAPMNVLVLDTYLGELAWTWHPTGGVVHQSDTKAHGDGIQLQGGHGTRLVNVTVTGHWSTTVGTGTPNSGSDTGWPDLPYTQATAEAQRYATVYGGGTFDIPGQRGHAMGGSLSGVMVNTHPDKDLKLDMEFAWVWGSGGAYFINSADETVGPWGTIRHLRVVNDQRVLAGGQGAAVMIRSGVVLTALEDAYYATDTTSWASTGVAITRRNT